LPTKKPADQVVKDIRRAARRRFSVEVKIRVVLDGLRGDGSIAERCEPRKAQRTLGPEPVLHLIQGVHGGGQAPFGWRCRPCRHRRRGARYPASNKLEIIRIVEQSHLPGRRTLDQLGIPRRTFCRWYGCHLDGGPQALADPPLVSSRVWKRIPADVTEPFQQERQAPTPPTPRRDSRLARLVAEAGTTRIGLETMGTVSTA